VSAWRGEEGAPPPHADDDGEKAAPLMPLMLRPPPPRRAALPALPAQPPVMAGASEAGGARRTARWFVQWTDAGSIGRGGGALTSVAATGEAAAAPQRAGGARDPDTCAHCLTHHGRVHPRSDHDSGGVKPWQRRAYAPSGRAAALSSTLHAVMAATGGGSSSSSGAGGARGGGAGGGGGGGGGEPSDTLQQQRMLRRVDADVDSTRPVRVRQLGATSSS
jgi:hypothetical protein